MYKRGEEEKTSETEAFERAWERRSGKASPGSQIVLWSSWRGYGGGFQLCDGLRSAGPKERQQTSSAEALELMVQQRPAERCAARVLRSVSGRYVRQQRLGTSSIDELNGLGTVQRCQNLAVLLPLHGGLPRSAVVLCSPLAGQCATSTPALKMILEVADIYSSRCFQISAAVLVNMSWCRALASNVLCEPFSPPE